MKLHLLCLSIAFAFLSSESASAQTAAQIEEYERRIEAQQQQLDQMRRELDALKAAVAQQDEAPELIRADQVEKENKFVLRKNENLELTFSGRVHRMLLTVDDGANTDMFFTDSEQGPTMLRFDATGKVDDSVSLARRSRPAFGRTDRSRSARTTPMPEPTLRFALPRCT